MSFIDYTVNWCRGEIFEGWAIVTAGFVLLAATLGFRKLGTTELAKAIVIPILVVTLLTLALGGYLVVQNKIRIPAFQEEYRQDPAAFQEKELKRVDGFVSFYKYTFSAAAVIMIAAVGLFFLGRTPLLKSIALAMMVFSFLLFIVDHFSRERALEYRENITREAGTK